MTNIHEIPENGAVVAVALNKLKASPRNARKTPHAPADIEALAASIAAKGVIQPLVVEPELDAAGEATGGFLVTVGEGRRQALRVLAKRKQIGKAHPVRCIVDTGNDPFEVSLDENVTRFAMHPADQFEAFRKLAEDRGFGPEEIAARFGVTPAVVRQRLRLAAVSPQLMAVYRAGEMSLDQLMVFSITEDHERQERVWESLSWNKDPHFIRRCLTEDRVRGTDRRAVYVGEAAYLDAGGVLERDLFSEAQTAWFADPALLDRLALETLEAVAEEVRREGWKWTQATLEPGAAFQMGRIYPHRVELPSEAQARLDEVSAEYERLAEQHDGSADPAPDLAERLTALGEEMQGLIRQQSAYAPEDVARAGVLVTLDHEGSVKVQRGFVRREDEPAEAEEEGEQREPERGARRATLPDALVCQLTAQRTAALADRLAAEPELALTALVHAFAVQTFLGDRSASCLEASLRAVNLAAYDPAIRDSRAGAAAAERHEAWARELPDEAEALWTQIVGMAAERRLALLAHCVAMGVNAVETTHRPEREPTPADWLAAALGLDMSAYWKPSAEGYFARITKPLILAAVREAASEAEAKRLEGLKKPEMAEAAERLLAGKGWVPDVLRTPAREAPEETPLAAE